MKTKAKVKRIENKDAKRVLFDLGKQAKAAAGAEVRIGVPDSTPAMERDADGNKRPTGTPLWLVAAAHEFGLGRVPERPAFRNGITYKKPQLVNFIKKRLHAVTQGRMTLEQAMDETGAKVAGLIQEGIAENTLGLAPLSDETKERKGSDVPLFDTGQLTQSITYEVKIK